MKLLYLVVSILSFICPGISSGQGKALSIEANIKGLDPLSNVTLTYYKGNKLDTLVAIAKAKETFTLKASSNAYPEFYFLKISSLKGVLTLFVDQGNINIKGDVTNWPKVEITGAVSQKEYQTYQDMIGPLEASGKLLTQKYNALEGSKDSIAVASVTDELTKSIAAFEKKQMEFATAHPNSYYSPVVINNARWDWMKKRAAYDKLSPLIKASKYGKLLAENIVKWKKASGLLELGDSVPEFAAAMPDGTFLSLQKELADNKLTLIDFWASWCVPCRQENPNLVKTYQDFQAKGFDIIGVSLDEKDADWRVAIAKDGLVWEQVSDLKGWASPIANTFFKGMPFNFIPQNFLVDAKGKILARNLRGDQLGKKVAELLNGNSL